MRSYIYSYHANLAFKPIADLVTRLGLSMSELGVTVRATEEKEEESAGMLKLDESAKETFAAFGSRMALPRK